ncbi:MAG: hypothetical protein HOW73_26835 [Polyangiaceae bacterium]|nr:hypothetical protein [Polyangiaceae bacterium]
MATMRYELFGDTLAILHMANAPSDDEWEGMLVYLRANWPARVVVFTDGGGPTTLQRGRLNDALSGKPLKTAVVTSSAVVRGIVTALSWFNAGIKTFTPDRAPAALRYLGVAVDAHEHLMQQVLKLSKQLTADGLKCVVWSVPSTSRSP